MADAQEIMYLPGQGATHFSVGDSVQLRGMGRGCEQLNGEMAVVKGHYQGQTGRFPVRVHKYNLDIMVMLENMISVERRESRSRSSSSSSSSSTAVGVATGRRGDQAQVAGSFSFRDELRRFASLVRRCSDLGRYGDLPTFRVEGDASCGFTSTVHLFGFSSRGQPAPNKQLARESAAEAYLWGEVSPTPARDDDVCALDCEMVEVEGRRSWLARVAVLNSEGEVLIDTYCRPQARITNFRTELSGIEPKDLDHAPGFALVRSNVLKVLQGKILVGHGLDSDLVALRYHHPTHLVRDSAKFPPLMRELSSWLCARSLKELASQELGLRIQTGRHCPKQDALAALVLYRKHRDGWDAHQLQSAGVWEIQGLLEIFRECGTIY